MKKLLSILAVFVLLLSACTTGSSEGTGEACSTENPDITLVTDSGGVNDKSFNQGTWEGVQKFCQENDKSADYIQTDDLADLEKNLNIAAEQSEVVVASGFHFAAAMGAAAQENPDTNFILIDASPTDADGNPLELSNVESFYFDEAQAGYLVGYIAGKTTKTNRIGFVGGDKIPPVEKFGYGYILGAQAANPDVQIDYQYTGSFTDAALGKTTAKTMYDQGADIIFACGGGVNDGVIQAGIDQNLNGSEAWVIGVDRDMYADGTYTNNDGEETSVILTSAVKLVGTAAYDGLEDHFNGDISGQVTTLDYESGGVGIPEENPNLEGQEDIVEEAKTSLEDAGQLPQSADELEPLVTVTVNGEY